MTDKLKCPFCGAELQKVDNSIPTVYECPMMCCKESENLVGTLDMWQAIIDGKKAQDALKVANKAIDCAERFLLGVQDKKIEMQKATRTSHLLLFQMPAMAALCLNTINDYKNEITSITKQEK